MKNAFGRECQSKVPVLGFVTHPPSVPFSPAKMSHFRPALTMLNAVCIR